MKKAVCIFSLLLLSGYFVLYGQHAIKSDKDKKILPVICITRAERSLYDLINKYRASVRLPDVPLSSSLTYVAQMHARDMADNVVTDNLCNLHSWSDKGDWTACCYTSDHKKAECMWEKPMELTNYQGYGYEIGYWNDFHYEDKSLIANDALEGWKESKGHKEVIINRGMWKKMSWKAMGVGIYKGYVYVWFGEDKDKEKYPGICQDE
jgi:hypothetical protein